MAKKPALVIDMMAAPEPDDVADEEVSSPSSEGQEPPLAPRDPEETIASIRSQLDQLEAAVRGLA